MTRHVGDGRDTYLRDMQIPDLATAQAYADIVHRNCLCMNGVDPAVEFTQGSNVRLRGRCYQRSGRIVLYGYAGFTWGTLAHELAHLHYNAHLHLSHGHEYKEAHCEILDMMEGMIPRP